MISILIYVYILPHFLKFCKMYFCLGNCGVFWNEFLVRKNIFCDSEEGLIKDWPLDYSLYGWLVSMKNGGELSAHIHDEGWITGSIYINVPPKSKKDSGNLVVATHDPKYGK